MSLTRLCDAERNAQNEYQVTVAQKIGQVLYSVTVDGIAGAVFITALLPPMVEPYAELVRAAVIATTYSAGDALRYLTDVPRPFADCDGWSPVKYVFATSITSLLGLGFGVIMMQFNADKPVSPDESLILTITAAPIEIMAFKASEALWNQIKTPPIVSLREPNESTTIVQKVMKASIRFVEPLVVYEMLHQLLIDAGELTVLQWPYFSVAAIGIDQVLKLTNYLIRVPQPLKNIVPEAQWQEREVRLFEVTHWHTHTERAPTLSAQAGYTALYFMQAVIVIAVAGFAALTIAQLIVGDDDFENLPKSERVGSLSVMLTLCTPVELGVQYMGSLIKRGWDRASGYCMQLFDHERVEQSADQAVVINAVGEDLENSDGEKQALLVKRVKN